MTQDDARQTVRAYLDSFQHGACGELDILDEHTMAIPIGWVFFYQSRAYLQSGETGDALGGNAPILVDARNGSLHVTGTARRIDYYIQNYLDTGNTHIEAQPVLIISGWREGAEKVAATRLLNEKTQLGLARSKHCIDDALENRSTEIRLPDFEKAETLRAALDELGWQVTILRKAP